MKNLFSLKAKKTGFPLKLLCNTMAAMRKICFLSPIISIRMKAGRMNHGFKTALTRVINDYARKNGVLKEADPNLSGDDVREGLTAIISIKHPDPQFEGQTKTKLGNSEVSTITNSFLGRISTIFIENPQIQEKYGKRLMAARARLAAKNAREFTRRKSALEVSSSSR